MHVCLKGWTGLKAWKWVNFAGVAVLLLGGPACALAASCTTQAALLPQDRAALANAGGRLAQAVVQQDFTTLQAALLPAEAAEWNGIRGVVEQAAPLVKAGQAQIRNLYLLDNSTQTATADTQFFCSNQSGSLTVTITMHALPPGRYAIVLADATGGGLSGQIGLILAWDTTATPGWKLGGVTVRPGLLDNHDGTWYWTRARELARLDMTWSAFYCYEAARYLLLPVDFISSPNLEKLGNEQAQLKNSPAEAFPLTLPAGDRNWKIDSVHLDTTLRQADLGVTYQSTGVTDPAAQRTEAIAVLSALLKAQPGLRENFHGLWAYAVNNGKTNPVMELPMAQIP